MRIEFPLVMLQLMSLFDAFHFVVERLKHGQQRLFVFLFRDSRDNCIKVFPKFVGFTKTWLIVIGWRWLKQNNIFQRATQMKYEYGSSRLYFCKHKVSLDRIRICTSSPIKSFCVFYEFATNNVAPHFYESGKLLLNFQVVIATVKKEKYK